MRQTFDWKNSKFFYAEKVVSDLKNITKDCRIRSKITVYHQGKPVGTFCSCIADVFKLDPE